MTNPAHGFLSHLIDLTTLEQATEEASTSLLSSSIPFSQLINKGIALGGCHVVKLSLGLGGRSLVELERSLAHHAEASFPPHDFRSGDSVRILGDAAGGEKGKGKATAAGGAVTSEQGAEGVVWKVTEMRIVIALGAAGKGGSNHEVQDVEVPPNCRLLKLSNPTTYLRQIAALRLAQRQVTQPTLPRLLSLLLGYSHPSGPNPLPQEFEFIDSTLNRSQRDAVRFALENEVALLWGPPGTGKTKTLVEVIRQLVVVQGLRVLVCGGSNLSVDNVLQRLATPPSPPSPLLPNPIPLTRLGHPARVLSSLTPLTLDSQSSRSDASSLVVDLKAELEELEGRLRLTGKERIRGSERKRGWETIRDLRRDYRKREGGIVREVLGKARVVLGTTHGVGSRMLERERFDVIVVDEAAQAAEPACWIPVAGQPGARKLILAGDHLQLPPTVKMAEGEVRAALKKLRSAKAKTATTTSSTAPPPLPSAPAPASDEPTEPTPPVKVAEQPASPPSEALATLSLTPSLARLPLLPLPLPSSLTYTLFERLLALHGPSIRQMLTVSYRFNSKICAFPSKELYDGELMSHESVEGRTLWGLLGELGVERKEGDEEGVLGEEVVFVDTAGLAMYERAGGDGSPSGGFGAESKSNENEAELCVRYVEQLVEANLPPSLITLLSPYAAQVSLLSSLLHPRWPDLQIGTVDSMQGRENEVVVISLVRSNEKGEVGFLGEKRRLNVATTRPRRQLVIIGDSSTVSKGSGYLKRWMDWLEEEAWVQVPE